MKLLKNLSDWWHGYSSDDVWSAYSKLSGEGGLGIPPTAGTVVPLTRREMNAIRDGCLVQFDGNRWLVKTHA